MLLAVDKMSGSEQTLVASDGPYTLRLKGAMSMSRHSSKSRRDYFREWKASIPGQAEREQESARKAERRQQLTEIVKTLGDKATAEDIRAQAYIQGLGKISGFMMSAIRNELWPNRRKDRPAPLVADRTPTGLVVKGDAVNHPCQACSSADTRIRQVTRLVDGSTKRQHVCKACDTFFFTIGDSSRRPHSRRLLHRVATDKQCSKCSRTLPVSAFGKKAGDADLYRSSCRECLNEYRRQRQLVQSFAQYGITALEYQFLISSQNNCCAICGTDCPGFTRNSKRRKTFAVDHCHKTGVLRGLLCNKCNLGLGNFNDDIERLEAAVAYLKRGGLNRKEVAYG